MCYQVKIATWMVSLIQPFNKDTYQHSDSTSSSKYIWKQGFYPCSYYQMFVSMQEWEDEEKNHIPQGSRRSHHSNSTINTGPKIYRVFLPTNSVPGKKIEIFLPEADRLVEVVVPSNLPNPIPTGTYIDVSL